MRKILDFCINTIDKLKAKARAFIAKEDALYYQNKKAHARRIDYFFIWASLFACSSILLFFWVVSIWTR